MRLPRLRLAMTHHLNTNWIVIASPKGVAISSVKGDCFGASPLAMTVGFPNLFIDGGD